MCYYRFINAPFTRNTQNVAISIIMQLPLNIHLIPFIGTSFSFSFTMENMMAPPSIAKICGTDIDTLLIPITVAALFSPCLFISGESRRRRISRLIRTDGIQFIIPQDIPVKPIVKTIALLDLVVRMPNIAVADSSKEASQIFKYDNRDIIILWLKILFSLPVSSGYSLSDRNFSIM